MIHFKSLSVLNLVVFLLFTSTFSACKKQKSSKSTSKEQVFILNKYTSFEFDDEFKEHYPVLIKEVYAASLHQAQLKKNKVSFQIDSTLHLKEGSLYAISLHNNSLEITAKDQKSLLSSINNVLKQARENSNHILADNFKPEIELEIKALHLAFVHWDKRDSLSSFKRMIDLAWENGYNTLILQLTSTIDFDSLKFMDTETTKKYSKKDINLLINYAQAYGLEVIPEVKLLTKQQKTFDFKEESLLFNEETYNPNNPEVYEHAFALIDEIIEMNDFNYFHIGHDEVYGSDKRTKNVEALDQDNFVQDVIKLNKYLKSKNVKIMMWADMLWDRKKFKIAQAGVKYLESYENAINGIPKDIILCDWHYKSNSKDFPTYDYFVGLGFETWGATWNNFEVTQDFTSYVVNTKSPYSKGIIATTWHLSNEEIEEIIISSGKIFRNAKN